MTTKLTPITIVIPVYRGVHETLTCIRSVLSAPVRVPFRVIIINDDSPEPDLVSALEALAEDARVILLHNARNLGFVATVNRGMREAGADDVVLLNSDTEVSAGWLDRLQACVHSAPDIGTATPFSNNATICSYPYPEWTGGLPAGMPLAQIDALFAEANAGQSVDIPTSVGFCMYIRQACLSETGLFDEQSFGRGYGEENDFCARALARGWRNVACGDVFVFHAGAVSFGGERAQRIVEAEQRLYALHPDYQGRLEAFLEADPLAPLRRNVDRARVRLGDTAVVDESAQLEARLRGEKNQLTRMLKEARAFVLDREADVESIQQDYLALQEKLGEQIGWMHAELDLCTQKMKARETLLGVLKQELMALGNSGVWRSARKVIGLFKSK